jgi:hypothetical protein
MQNSTKKLFLGRAKETAEGSQLNFGDTTDAKSIEVVVDAKPTGLGFGHCAILTAKNSRLNYSGRDFLYSNASRRGNGEHTFKINRGETAVFTTRDSNNQVAKYNISFTKSGSIKQLSYSEMKEALLGWGY